MNIMILAIFLKHSLALYLDLDLCSLLYFSERRYVYILFKNGLLLKIFVFCYLQNTLLNINPHMVKGQ